MDAQLVSSTRRPVQRAGAGIRSLAAFALAALMALGCVVLWAGIPTGWLWLAAAISHKATTIYLITLLGAPVTMIVWGFALGRLNAAYLALRGADEPKLFQALVVGTALLAILAFLVWFFVFAGSPSATPWPDEVSGPGI